MLEKNYSVEPAYSHFSSTPRFVLLRTANQKAMIGEYYLCILTLVIFDASQSLYFIVDLHGVLFKARRF